MWKQAVWVISTTLILNNATAAYSQTSIHMAPLLDAQSPNTQSANDGIEMAVLLSASNDPETATIPAPGDEADIFYGIDQIWADLLALYLSKPDIGPSRFDYAALLDSEANMQNLDQYIQHLSAQSPSQYSRDEALVYWANLYNALTVQIVTQHFPVKSIREIKSGWRAGPWKRKLITVDGKTLSLDMIEHDIMRSTFKTPLVHYMINCASIGCPDLKATPWRVETLNDDLDHAARTYINAARGISVSKGRVKASSLYKWFRKDFGGSEAAVLSHIRTYANDRLKTELANADKIDKYKYDWAINAP